LASTVGGDALSPECEARDAADFMTTEATQFFFELTPERILSAVETVGLRCTGRCLTLNSMENRVYEVEIEMHDDDSPSARFRVAKFYRPGRWSEEQIREEHRFLLELQEDEIPVVAPIVFADGSTVQRMPGTEIFFALFPKQGGRNPQELNCELAERIGRLLARIHVVGGRSDAPSRIRLTPETYGVENLRFLRSVNAIPRDLEGQFVEVVGEICERSQRLFSGVPVQRLHGDCHLGNLLYRDDTLFFVDFDDMVVGPCVQDLWLLLPGDDQEGRMLREALLEGYEELRSFDRSTLALIEPLRALRLIHYSAWLTRRWEDPVFPRTFPHYGTPAYWRDLLADLEEQRGKIAQL
jgi:Ser/Thr protein kinase RdoA (MazF antagonist)